MDKPTPGAPVAKRHHGEPQVTNTAVTMSSPRPALRHLLVPLDGTSRGEHAIPFAEALAAVSGAQVLLMRVSTAEERHVATIYLATVAGLLRARGLVIETVVRSGEPAATIVEEAARRKIDLIILGTSGRGLLGSGAGGSVASRLLEQSAVPILLVRDWHGPLARQRFVPGAVVILPLDGSALAEEALPGAIALVTALQGELVLLHVARPRLPWSGEPADAPDAASGAESTRPAPDDYLRRIAHSLAATGVTCRVEVRSGAAADEIAAEIRRTAAAAAVVATHGQSGVASTTMGNVARDVIWGGSAPLVLVRPAAMCPQGAQSRPAPPLPRPPAEGEGPADTGA